MPDRLDEDAGHREPVLMPQGLPPLAHTNVRRVPSGYHQTRGRHRPGWRRDDVLGWIVDIAAAAAAAVIVAIGGSLRPRQEGGG